jgi:hypothetical protein
MNLCAECFIEYSEKGKLIDKTKYDDDGEPYIGLSYAGGGSKTAGKRKMKSGKAGIKTTSRHELAHQRAQRPTPALPLICGARWRWRSSGCCARR